MSTWLECKLLRGTPCKENLQFLSTTEFKWNAVALSCFPLNFGKRNQDSQLLQSAFDLPEPAGTRMLEEWLDFNRYTFVWEQAEEIVWSESD